MARATGLCAILLDKPLASQALHIPPVDYKALASHVSGPCPGGSLGSFLLIGASGSGPASLGANGNTFSPNKCSYYA